MKFELVIASIIIFEPKSWNSEDQFDPKPSPNPVKKQAGLIVGPLTKNPRPVHPQIIPSLI